MENVAYTVLKNASGNCNVCGIVQYFRKPTKTKGTSHSLFVSVTDPSLNGSRLKCIIFNDSVESLPQISEVGTVILMHNLTVKTFHGEPHGCGFGCRGFSAMVFSGSPADKVEPLPPSVANCTITRSQVDTVQSLRTWFASPTCPVKRLNTASSSSVSLATPSATEASVNRVTRLGDLKPGTFTCIEGQVVAIYRRSSGRDCRVVYLWDGTLVRGVDPVRPPSHQVENALELVSLDPRLSALTAHRLCSEGGQPVDDLSVPVSVYDEHSRAPCMGELRPGDLLRINNVHVSGHRQIILHGGGQPFNSGLQIIATRSSDPLPSIGTLSLGPAQGETLDSAQQPGGHQDLLVKLYSGRKQRPAGLQTSLSRPMDKFSSLSKPLTIARILDLPRRIHHQSNRRAKSNSSWFLFSADNDPEEYMIGTRLVGRVLDYAPKTANELADALLLICPCCRSAHRLTCRPDLICLNAKCRSESPVNGEAGAEQGEVDEEQVTQGAPSGSLLLVPTFLVRVGDPTGSLVVTASGQNSLLRQLQKSMQAEDWQALVGELLLRLSSPSLSDVCPPAVDRLLHRLELLLRGQWIDLAVCVKWNRWRQHLQVLLL